MNDDFVEPTLQCLEEYARTSKHGHIGDGKVLVMPMDQAFQISDGMAGPGAL